MSISFIIPTIGRASLADAIRSVELWPGDQLVIVHHSPPGGAYGGHERREGISRATCTHLAFLDDDDQYVPGHRAIMQAAIDAQPDKPHLFRMQFPDGLVLWREPIFACGNLGSPMILVPNDPAKLGQWTFRRCGDFDFLNSSRWIKRKDFQFQPAIIARLGHNEEALAR